MTVSKLVIFGSSGHARVIVDIIESNSLYELVGFIDDKSSVGTKVLDYEIIGNTQSLIHLMKKYNFSQGVIGIGDNFIRSKVAAFIENEASNFKFVNCIHASANVTNYCQLGVGNVVMPGVSINSSSIIANHCILNTNSSLDHDCHMGDFSCLAPNSAVGGNGSIGKFSYVGLGASVFHRVSIGKNCIIGGGSLVDKSTKTNSIYYGNPAKFISNRKLGDKYL